MVQFLVLAHAHTHPDLTTNSGNLALLKRAGELGLIEVEAAEAIRSLYRTLRGLQHRMRLNNITPCRVPPGEIDTTPARVLWETLFEDSSFNAS